MEFFLVNLEYRRTQGGGGVMGDKSVPSLRNFHSPYIPSLPKFGKTSSTRSLEIQTVCIYDLEEGVNKVE